MIDSADDYFRIIVQPTVEEYFKDKLSIRKGLLAALVLHQMADHYALDGKNQLTTEESKSLLKPVLEQLVADYPDYQLIHDVADATKHAKLSVKKGPSNRQITSSKDVSVAPGLFEAPFGQGRFSEAIEIYITKIDDTEEPLMPLIIDVFELWRKKLCIK